MELTQAQEVEAPGALMQAQVAEALEAPQELRAPEGLEVLGAPEARVVLVVLQVKEGVPEQEAQQVQVASPVPLALEVSLTLAREEMVVSPVRQEMGEPQARAETAEREESEGRREEVPEARRVTVVVLAPQGPEGAVLGERRDSQVAVEVQAWAGQEALR